MTTTALRIDFMVDCIGIRLISQRSTPMTIRVITTFTMGMGVTGLRLCRDCGAPECIPGRAARLWGVFLRAAWAPDPGSGPLVRLRGAVGVNQGAARSPTP